MFEQVTTGFDGFAKFLNYLIIILLLIPFLKLIRLTIDAIYKGDIAFKSRIDRDLKNFCIGNKLAVVGYKPYVKFKFDKNLLTIRFRLDGHQISKKFLGLEQQLADMLILQVDKHSIKDGFAVYTFRRKPLNPSRITIRDEIENENLIKINDEIYWDFKKEPHALINGGTGGGKTFFIIYLTRVILGLGAFLKVLDPKRSILYSLRYYLGNTNVAAKHEDIANILINTVAEMEKRFEDIEKLRLKDKNVTNDYSSYGFKPVFIIFDELMAFMRGGIEQKTKQQAFKALLDIIAMGREAGFFVIIAMQRGSTKSLDGDIRDQLHFRCTLGKMGEEGYKMAFGENYHLKKTLEEKGTGFIQIYGNEKLGEPQEFYSPFIDKDYDFFSEVEELAKDLYPELYKKKQEKDAKKAKEERAKEKKLVELEEKKKNAVKPDIRAE
jgi:hypothetical protein